MQSPSRQRQKMPQVIVKTRFWMLSGSGRLVIFSIFFKLKNSPKLASQGPNNLQRELPSRTLIANKTKPIKASNLYQNNWTSNLSSPICFRYESKFYLAVLTSYQSTHYIVSTHTPLPSSASRQYVTLYTFPVENTFLFGSLCFISGSNYDKNSPCL